MSIWGYAERVRYLELGPEKNRHTKRAKFSNEWTTIGRSQKTPLDYTHDLDGNLPFFPDSFDVVFASHVLEHLRNPVATLRECYRVLKPGGACRMNVPDARFFIKNYQAGKLTIDELVNHLRSFAEGMHKWGFDPGKLKGVFVEAGFDKVRLLQPGKTSIEACNDPYFWTRQNRTIYCEGRKP
jgi:predicted SAM-dependent methyltransferase